MRMFKLVTYLPWPAISRNERGILEVKTRKRGLARLVYEVGQDAICAAKRAANLDDATESPARSGSAASAFARRHRQRATARRRGWRCAARHRKVSPRGENISTVALGLGTI